MLRDLHRRTLVTEIALLLKLCPLLVFEENAVVVRELRAVSLLEARKVAAGEPLLVFLALQEGAEVERVDRLVLGAQALGGELSSVPLVVQLRNARRNRFLLHSAVVLAEVELVCAR